MTFYGILDAKLWYRKDARESFKERTHRIEIEVEILLEKVGDNWTTRSSGNTASHPGASNAGLVITGVNSAQDPKLARAGEAVLPAVAEAAGLFQPGREFQGDLKAALQYLHVVMRKTERDTMKNVNSTPDKASTVLLAEVSFP